jgi:hypothetical protein
LGGLCSLLCSSLSLRVRMRVHVSVSMRMSVLESMAMCGWLSPTSHGR